jgi:hypothetical protein
VKRWTLLILVAVVLGFMWYFVSLPNDEDVQLREIQIFESVLHKNEAIAQPSPSPLKEIIPQQALPQQPKLAPETLAFLHKVEHADSLEDVFATPSRHVVVNKIQGYWVSQGDILIDESQFVEGIGDENTRLAKLQQIEKWPSALIPYRIEPGVDSNSVLQAITLIQKHTQIRFADRTNQADFVVFRPIEQEICMSYVGRKGGEQYIYLNASVCKFGNILHEIMHTLGFIHEHSREDRDHFVTVHWENIEPALQYNFQKMTSDLSGAETFDFDSVLLYGSDSFSIANSPSMTKLDGQLFKANRAGLSPEDIKKINHLYPE